ncbi:MAG: M15 family metallopeptidase [Solobacterium sp.]|nr:M15 family metallopeptidase [Solobacterium sp.]
MKRLLTALLIVLLLLLGIGVYGLLTKPSESAAPGLSTLQGIQKPEASEEPTIEPTAEPTPEPEPTIDPAVFTDTDSLLVVANKKHRLPEGYVPADLVVPNIAQVQQCTMRAPAAEAIQQMAEAAAADGVTLKISSAYRGEDYQRQLYNGYSASYGRATADTISSRPGYSDHQTGLAADFVEGDGSMNGINFNQAFEDTASGNWLRDHAHEYGFIMRYPKDKQDITGYAYEPWHFRYIGVDYATAIYETDVFETFEEYFGVEGGDYAE